jgi:spore maturation protein A
MMKWIWSGMIVLSVVTAAATGRMNALSQAAVGGAADAVSLFLLLLGTMCLWNGLMEIAQSAGITRAAARLIAPMVRRLFPDLAPESEGAQAVTMNLTANFLGLGNAATPFGLRAMKYMDETPHEKGTATDSMAMFIVMNTASVQLVPATLAAVRIKCGSAAPFDILPCIWLSSAVTLAAGIICARLMSHAGR